MFLWFSKSLSPSILSHPPYLFCCSPLKLEGQKIGPFVKVWRPDLENALYSVLFYYVGAFNQWELEATSEGFYNPS